MKENTDGISVLKYALGRTRLRVFTGNELMPTQEVLGMSSFCAQKGGWSGCIIDENEIGELEYLSEIRESHNTTIIVVVIGNQISQKFVHKMRAYNMPTFLPYNLKSLVEMIGAGTLYSRIKKAPCVVYVSRRLLTSIESFNVEGICRDRIGGMIKGSLQAENILYEIESRCTRVEGSGDVVIITSDYAYQIVKHVVSPKTVSICNVGMVNPFVLEEIPFAKKYILVGPLAAYFDEFFPNSEVIEPAQNPLHEGEKIERELQKILNKKHVENYAKQRPQQDTLSVKKPDVPRRDNAMCGDCKYRFEELRILEEEKIERENVYEDIFCEVLGTRVSSGVANAKNFYSADIIFSNQKNEKYNAKRIRRLDDRCTLNFDLQRKFSIGKSLRNIREESKKHKSIICGFDFETTRKEINAYIAGKPQISVMYSTDIVWRNDSVLCHMIVGYDDICPYILKGQADAINAKTANDALAYIEWLKDGGRVKIHSRPKLDFGERYSQFEAYKYLKKLMSMGLLYLD